MTITPGYKMSDEQRKKISLFRIGTKASLESRKKISNSKIGKKRKPFSEKWLKNMSLARIGKKHKSHKSNGGGWKLSEEAKRKISESKKGKRISEEIRKRMSEGQKGKHYSVDRRIKQSIRMKGEKHFNWKGGECTRNKKQYFDINYKLWREAVFARDLYTCKICGISGVYITAHHIKSWANYPDLRYEIDNGQTLCEECHSKTDNYKGRNRNKNKKL